MNYIMIQNEGEIDINGIRLLGQSVKKSPNSIGQFGTGLKEIIALCLRRETELIIMSGEKKVTFGIVETKFRDTMVEEIVYKVDGVSQSMNISKDLGQQDWTTEWQILRELICNAQDEGGLHVDTSDTVSGIAGSTRVYVEATYDIMEEWSTIKQKLLFLTKRVPVHGDCIYNKPSGRKGYIYKKGVFIREVDSLFDYELKDLSLTESRTADIYQVIWGINKLPFNAEYTRTVVDEIINTDKTPVEMGSLTAEMAELWNSEHPDSVVCFPTLDQIGKVKEAGFKPIHIKSDNKYIKLKDAGFRNPDMIRVERSAGVRTRIDVHPMWKVLLKRTPPVFLCPDLGGPHMEEDGSVLVRDKTEIDNALKCFELDIVNIKRWFDDKH